MERGELEKKIELNWLSAFYGALLTPKQQEVMRLHCEEDLSLGEIARETGISRQAVHDLLSRAAHQLFTLEAKLGAAERFRRMEAGLKGCEEALAAGRYDQALAGLRALRAIDQEESHGL